MTVLDVPELIVSSAATDGERSKEQRTDKEKSIARRLRRPSTRAGSNHAKFVSRLACRASQEGTVSHVFEPADGGWGRNGKGLRLARDLCRGLHIASAAGIRPDNARARGLRGARDPIVYELRSVGGNELNRFAKIYCRGPDSRPWAGFVRRPSFVCPVGHIAGHRSFSGS